MFPSRRCPFALIGGTDVPGRLTVETLNLSEVGAMGFSPRGEGSSTHIRPSPLALFTLLFHYRAGSDLFGTLPITAGFLSRFFNFLVLALFFGSRPL